MTRSTSSSDAFDELAAMFMTPADDDGNRERSDGSEISADTAALPWREIPVHNGLGAGAFTEVLLVGHLPVRGNLWLTPYADSLAREVGTVALIRLDGERPTLEILRGRAQWRSEIAGLPLAEVIDLIACEVRAWVIRPKTTDESLLPEVLDRADRLTILSSADQAASVAAYQMFKRIKHEADDSGIELPGLFMAVVGGPPEGATWMVRRLQATAMSQLELSIELARVLPRIDSDIQSSVYLRFADEPDLAAADVMSMIEQAVQVHRETDAAYADHVDHAAQRKRDAAPRPMEPAGANGHHHTDAQREQATSVASPLTDAPAHRTAAPHKSSKPMEWDPIVRTTKVTERDDDLTARAVGVKLMPKPAQRNKNDAPHTATGDEHAEQSLAAHVPGLTPLAIRCPRSDRVEFAIDAHGGIHLLAEETNLRDLRIVEAWAKSHRELLAMALADDAADPASRITCHVFTNEPASVADLHGTEIKLHVLAPVEVEGRRGWYAAALNQ